LAKWSDSAHAPVMTTPNAIMPKTTLPIVEKLFMLFYIHLTSISLNLLKAKV
jgi:hypothetical protein